MEYRYLGNSGLQVSALSLGAWVTYGEQVGEEVAHACMSAAYEAGVNFFDNAESYGKGNAEVVVGNVIKKAAWKRSDLVISTKIFWGGRNINACGLSRKHIIEGARAALARLQMEYVDLIFCHRPDIHTPVEETVRAMNFLINQGLAFYWGTSEWSAAQIMEAVAVARQNNLIPPLMEQPEYNMFNRERVEAEYAPLYRTIGLGTTIWSPLASGLLTGKYNEGIPDDTRISLPQYAWLRDELTNETARKNIETVKQLVPFAQELNCSMAQLALAWCLKNPHVSTVITGASKPEQVVENMRSLEVAERLTPELMERIDLVLNNKPESEPDYR
jgi:voltage-dependent potassium channel beta subunit